MKVQLFDCPSGFLAAAVSILSLGLSLSLSLTLSSFLPCESESSGTLERKFEKPLRTEKPETPTSEDPQPGVFL